MSKHSRKLPPSQRRGTQATVATAPQKVDYTHFGEMGPAFQALHEEIWGLVEGSWNNLPDVIDRGGIGVPKPTLPALLSQYFTRSGFLYPLVESVNSLFRARSPDQIDDVWESFAQCFSPPLSSAKAFLQDRAGLLLRPVFANEVHASVLLQLQESRMRLSNICHGPFTTAEMAYLLKRHPRVMEVGCGSGYFAAEFSKQGDIIAQDNNKYELSAAYPWTAALQSQGKLVITEDSARFAAQHADRALLISWPEPGSAFASRCLESYMTAGGKTLLLKLGGFVGAGRFLGKSDYVMPANPGDNIAWFFELLADGWQESDDADRPGWNPRALTNNLLVFRRKDKNR